MKIVALLPMKENSERVKGKNFKIFCGKPLYSWVLDSLLSIEDIDNIIINTDAKNILNDIDLNQNKKIILRKRDKSICGDLVSMNKIIEDDINNIDSDIYLMTHTTNPLLQRSSIRDAINLFKSNIDKNDSLFSVNKIQTRFYDSFSKPINHDPNNLLRTQDLDPYYEENSNLYIFTKKSFFASNARIGKKPMMYETKFFESIDIDTPDDWELAEILVEYYKKRGII